MLFKKTRGVETETKQQQKKQMFLSLKPQTNSRKIKVSIKMKDPRDERYFDRHIYL